MLDNPQPDSGRSSSILLHYAKTALMYEELRAAIDGGHESMTHADALAEISAIRAENETLRAALAAAPTTQPAPQPSPTPQADSVTAPAGGANWQDISTAPKDGTRFVAVGQNYGLDSEKQHICIAQRLAGCWVEVSDWNGASNLKYLTHWMPLPPLPGSTARKQGANHD